TGLLIHRKSIFDNILHIVLGSGNKKCPFFVYVIEQTKKIYISFIHYINCSRLNIQLIQHLDIMCGSLSEMNINREIAAQIQQSVHLDPSLVLSKLSPRTQLQAQAYCTAIKRIYQIVHIKSEAVVSLIHRTCNSYEHLGIICINTPITKFIGLCKSISGN